MKCFKMLNIKPGTLFDGRILLWFSRFLSIVTTWLFPLAKNFFFDSGNGLVVTVNFLCLEFVAFGAGTTTLVLLHLRAYSVHK